MLSLTINDLLDWEDENEEDVFVDGPWTFDDDKAQVFIDRLNAKFKSAFSPAKNQWELNIHGVIDSWPDSKREKVFQIFAEFLNDFGVES